MKLRLASSAAIVALMIASGTARADEVTAPSSPESSTSTSTGTSTSTVAGPTAATTEPPSTGSKRTAWPWIVMGTGVALVVTAIVLEVNAVRQDDKREANEVKLTALPAGDPGRKPIEAAIEDHKDSASNGRTAALIVGTVGFLTVAGSVVLWFVEGSSGSSAAPAAALKPKLVPSLGPTYAGASLGVSF